MNYFVISDIHGHFDEMITCLDEAGYDEKDNTHKLIVVGDMIDRGSQSKEVLEYAYRLYKDNKAHVIMGNHDKFLLDFFNKDYKKVIFNFERNGHMETFKSLLNKEVKEEEFDQINQELFSKYNHLYEFLNELPCFLEIEDYIFVHGGIDVSLDDWRKDSVRNFTWNYQFKMDPLPGKTIVCGHVQVAYIRSEEKDLKKVYEETPELFDIFHRDGVIYIDGSILTTKKINVLRLEI